MVRVLVDNTSTMLAAPETESLVNLLLGIVLGMEDYKVCNFTERIEMGDLISVFI